MKELTSENARKKIIEKLNKENLLVKQEKIRHPVPVSERGKHPIEFVTMPEYYVKQTNEKEKMLKITQKIKFYSPQTKQILIDWINTIKIDWPISRRRYYGTEIPLWYCQKCGKPFVPKKGKYYQPWKQPCPIKKCPACGSSEWRGETRVLDTWFDSANSASYLLGKGRNDEFFKKHLPCTLRPQGKEIVRTWLYYSLLKHYLLYETILFDSVYIHQHILDGKGKKMSKSIGNVIGPNELLSTYGAEPLRLWAALDGDLTKGDISCSYERVEGAGKTLTKFWNVARFISSFPKIEGEKELLPLDQWILNELSILIQKTKEGFEQYDYHVPATAMRYFLWEIFASHYLEMVKNRAYNQEEHFSKKEQNGAIYTLNYCLKTLLQLFSPIIPIFTFYLYEKLYERKNIHQQPFPKIEHQYELLFTTQKLMETNSVIWKAKKDAGKSLKSSIASAILPKELKVIEADLKKTHSIEKIEFGEGFELQL